MNRQNLKKIYIVSINLSIYCYFMPEVKKTTPTPASESSNYEKGREAQKVVGQTVKDLVGGSYQHRTKGSKGANNVTVYKENGKKYEIKVRASQDEDGKNKNSKKDIERLVESAKEKGTIPLIADVHGDKIRISYASSGKTLYTTKKS